MKRLAIILLLIGVLCFTSSCTSATDYNHLLTKYNNLVNDYNELHTGYNELVNDYNELATQLEGAIVPPYTLVKDREINLVFRNLDGNLEYWNSKAEILEANIVLGTFMRDFDISELNRLGLRNIAQRFANANKYVDLGGKFTCLDFRPYILKENFQDLALKFYSEHTDDESRIEEVWNMVTQLCPYTDELKETPRLPSETLLFSGGDCEDVAILTASILKAMPAEWKVSLVYMDSDNPTNINEVNHVTVHVDTGEYKTFVESTEEETMCPWDEVDGFYLEIQ